MNNLREKAVEIIFALYPYPLFVLYLSVAIILTGIGWKYTATLFSRIRDLYVARALIITVLYTPFVHIEQDYFLLPAVLAMTISFDGPRFAIFVFSIVGILVALILPWRHFLKWLVIGIGLYAFVFFIHHQWTMAENLPGPKFNPNAVEQCYSGLNKLIGAVGDYQMANQHLPESFQDLDTSVIDSLPAWRDGAVFDYRIENGRWVLECMANYSCAVTYDGLEAKFGESGKCRRMRR